MTNPYEIDGADLDNFITGHGGEDSMALDSDEEMNPDMDVSEVIERSLARLTLGNTDGAADIITEASLAATSLRILAEGDPEGFRGILFSLWARIRKG